MKAYSKKLGFKGKITNFWLVFSVFFFLPFSGNAQEKSPKKIRLGPELVEVSGLYIESPQRFWWHNDSGNPPILFQTDQEGNILEEILLSDWSNKDWEDITYDDAGNIYVGDFGNNCNCRDDLKIYRINPDTQQLDSILFSFEDQTEFPPDRVDRNFDLEAFFWHDGQLHLFSKNTLAKGGSYICKHYVLPAEPGEYEAQIIEETVLPKRVVTGAAISPDGTQIALVSYRFKRILGFIPFSQASVFVFSDFKGDRFFEGERSRQGIRPFFLATQYESIDYLDDRHIYVASEQTVFIRPKAKKLKIKP